MPDIKSESTPFKVKRTTLNVNKFLEKDESSSATLGKVDGEESGVGNLARIVRHSRIKINNNEKKITHLKNIHNLRKIFCKNRLISIISITIFTFIINKMIFTIRFFFTIITIII